MTERGYATCCPDGRCLVSTFNDAGKVTYSLYDSAVDIRYCPFCAAELAEQEKGWEEALGSLLTSVRPGTRVCFDVDGVICDDSDPSLPYAERRPYPHAVQFLRAFAASGGVIVLQTARYMARHRGAQEEALVTGAAELRGWLDRHNVPWHDMYFGKAGEVALYVDDKACLVRSTRGITDWVRNLLPRLTCPTTSSAVTAATEPNSS